MQSETHHTIWLDSSQLVSISDLVDLSGLTEREVHELVEFGALVPLDAEEIPWRFSADCVVTVRKASRLRDDLELDSHAVVLALTLLDRIRALEAQLVQARAQQSVYRHL